MLIDFCKDHQVANSANHNLLGTQGTLLQMQFYLKNRKCKYIVSAIVSFQTSLNGKQDSSKEC